MNIKLQIALNKLQQTEIGTPEHAKRKRQMLAQAMKVDPKGIKDTGYSAACTELAS